MFLFCHSISILISIFIHLQFRLLSLLMINVVNVLLCILSFDLFGLMVVLGLPRRSGP